mmetsp:Transcript_54756/g.124711  ORF Transcript_54756/g.124711 Transcript_54756/m.124711 type:complete len:242 (+) Transcript_54756:137-862(+)
MCDCIVNWWIVLKGLLFAPLTISIVTIGNFVLALGFLPVDVLRVYKTVTVTPYLGPNLKLLCMLLLPLPLLLKPFAIATGSVFCGFFVGFKSALESLNLRRSTGVVALCGLDLAVTSSLNVVHDTYHVLGSSFFGYLDDFTRPPPGTVVAFDLSPIQILVALGVATFGLMVDTSSYAVIAIIKAPLGVIRWVCKLWDFSCDAGGGDPKGLFFLPPLYFCRPFGHPSERRRRHIGECSPRCL